MLTTENVRTRYAKTPKDEHFLLAAQHERALAATKTGILSVPCAGDGE